MTWPTFTHVPKSGTGLWVRFVLDDGSEFTALIKNDLSHYDTHCIEIQLASSRGLPVVHASLIRKFIKEATILQVVGRPDGMNQHGVVPTFRRKFHNLSIQDIS